MTLYSIPVYTVALTAIATLLYYHSSVARREGNRMLDALWIVLLGMAIIFAVLGILLVVMMLLSKVTSPKKKEEQEG